MVGRSADKRCAVGSGEAANCGVAYRIECRLMAAKVKQQRWPMSHRRSFGGGHGWRLGQRGDRRPPRWASTGAGLEVGETAAGVAPWHVAAAMSAAQTIPPAAGAQTGADVALRRRLGSAGEIAQVVFILLEQCGCVCSCSALGLLSAAFCSRQ